MGSGSVIVERFGLYVILFAGGMIYAADYFGVPWLYSLAVICFGLWLVAWGVEVTIKGQVTLVNQGSGRSEFFSGLPAGLLAAIFITTGLAFLLFGWLDLRSPGSTGSFFDRLTASPAGWGAITGAVGIFIAALGLIRLLSGSDLIGAASRFTVINFHLAGVRNLVVGLFLTTVGAGLIFAPELLLALWEGLKKNVSQWLLRLVSS